MPPTTHVGGHRAHLRDGIDLDWLGADMVTVVEETMRTARTALRLRPMNAISETYPCGGRGAMVLST